jgi:osmotically-inducible protein OsmY
MLFASKRSATTTASLLMMVILIAACATSPPRSPEQIRTDQATEERVNAALDADPIHYYRHVDVRVDGGVAHLSGYVWSSDALFKAKQIAAGIPGVTLVVNEMELQREVDESGGGHDRPQ